MSEDITPAQLRDAFEAAQKEVRKLEKQNADLMKSNRELVAKQAFTEASLSPDLADLYVAANPDADAITADLAKEFAAKYGIGASTVETEEVEEQKEPPATEGLENIARAGSKAGGTGQPPASKVITRDEFLALQRTDPAAARLALVEGRVGLRSDNPMASSRGATEGRNPFAPVAASAE